MIIQKQSRRDEKVKVVHGAVTPMTHIIPPRAHVIVVLGRVELLDSSRIGRGETKRKNGCKDGGQRDKDQQKV